VTLTQDERYVLEGIAKDPSQSARVKQRARIVLLAAGGKENRLIALELGVTATKVARWRSRYLVSGIEGVKKDAPRPGRPRTVTDELTSEVLRLTALPCPSGKRWSARKMAAATRLSEGTVRRIWRAHGIRPHLSEESVDVLRAGSETATG
jgi:transposase